VKFGVEYAVKLMPPQYVKPDWRLYLQNPPQWKRDNVSSHKTGNIGVTKRDKSDREEPAWLNPANDRNTPHTDEEIGRLAEDFILGLDDQEWLSLKTRLGVEANARTRIRAGFVKMDAHNLINITPKGPVH